MKIRSTGYCIECGQPRIPVIELDNGAGLCELCVCKAGEKLDAEIQRQIKQMRKRSKTSSDVEK